MKHLKTIVVLTILAAGVSVVGQTVRFRLPQVAGDPATVANGDLWYNTSSNAFRARINGSTVSMGAGLTSPVAAADGGTGQTTPTADNVLVGDGAAWNKKALPSCSNATNDKLLYDASTDAFSCGTDQAGSGGGGLVLLESHTASASSELAFTSWYSASYDTYLIEVVNLVPTADGEVRLQISTDGGSSYVSSNYNTAYAYLAANSGATGAVGGANSYITFGFSTEATSPAATSFNGSLTLYGPGSTSRAKFLQGFSNNINTSGDYLGYHCTGVWTQTTAVNAFKIYVNSTTIASGTARVYGYEK